MSQQEAAAGRIDWDSYVLKHYVRLRGWLEPCKYRWRRVDAQIRSSDSDRDVPLKYFTFCASNAIDVFMLEQAGVLNRSQDTGRLDTVYFCEEDPHEYQRIIERVGQNGFLGRFEKIVLFEDDDDTLSNSLDTNPPREIRLKLQFKEQHKRLREAFPFDIVNLDMSTPFFPPNRDKISPMLQTIRTILDWELEPDRIDGHECDAFTLLLTSYVTPELAQKNAVDELVTRMERNIDNHDSFRQAYEDRWGNIEVRQLMTQDFGDFFAAALPKVIVYEALHRGWAAQYRGIYLYEPPDQRQESRYQMMSSVTHFERLSVNHVHDSLFDTVFEVHEDKYVEATAGVVENDFQDCNQALEQDQTEDEIDRHLQEVVSFREETLSALTR